MTAVAERVAAGVRWLDTNDPGWWRTDAPPRPDASEVFGPGGPIDLEALLMQQPCYCVLGQRWGLYYSAPIRVDQAVACGFDADSEAEFDGLADEWIRVIEGRRQVEAARREAACCPCRGLLCDPECGCNSCPKSELDLGED